MKPIFFAIFFLLVLSKAFSQQDSIRGKQFNLIGKLMKPVEGAPYCGVVAWAVVVEFEIINLTGVSCPNKHIGIVVTCPIEYGSNFFKKGTVYHVLFSDTNQADFEWAVLNKATLAENKLSFVPYAVSIRKML